MTESPVVSKVKSKSRKIKVKNFKKPLAEAVNPKLAVFMFGLSQTMWNLKFLPSSLMLLPEDFKASLRVSIGYKYLASGPLPKKFKFKHMLPNVFRVLRKKFGISEQDFQDSVNLEPVEILCTHRNAYISVNKLFIFKVVESSCADNLLSIMPDYHKYLSERKFISLLPQYVGLFKLFAEGKNLYVIAMRNIFTTTSLVTAYQSFHYFQEKEKEKDKEKNAEVLNVSGDGGRTASNPNIANGELNSEGCAQAVVSNYRMRLPLSLTESCRTNLQAIFNHDVNFLSSIGVYGCGFLLGVSDKEFNEAELKKLDESVVERRRDSTPNKSASNEDEPKMQESFKLAEIVDAVRRSSTSDKNVAEPASPCRPVSGEIKEKRELSKSKSLDVNSLEEYKGLKSGAEKLKKGKTVDVSIFSNAYNTMLLEPGQTTGCGASTENEVKENREKERVRSKTVGSESAKESETATIVGRFQHMKVTEGQGSASVFTKQKGNDEGGKNNGNKSLNCGTVEQSLLDVKVIKNETFSVASTERGLKYYLGILDVSEYFSKKASTSTMKKTPLAPIDKEQLRKHFQKQFLD